MQTADFYFDLPQDLIAQHPLPARDESRLLVLERATGFWRHRKFRDLIEYLKEGDVLVLNNSRVIPARLRGVNPQTGGKFEILLLEEMSLNDWWAMLKPGKRAGIGAVIDLLKHDGAGSGIRATVTEVNAEGHRRLRFSGVANICDRLEELGEMPLPPYIYRRGAGELGPDKMRYQTVYAEPPGSVAAPTAGLHFTKSLLEEIRARGVRIEFVTLHVGPGTFAPVKAAELVQHVMHEERFELAAETVEVINAAKARGGQIFAVGTTTVRVLESVAAANGGILVAGSGRTKLFLYPPAKLHVADALVTNFHLPHSTLLMLVSAFAAPGETRGRDLVLKAYAEAIRERYRFFSYGDAMLLH